MSWCFTPFRLWHTLYLTLTPVISRIIVMIWNSPNQNQSAIWNYPILLGVCFNKVVSAVKIDRRNDWQNPSNMALVYQRCTLFVSPGPKCPFLYWQVFRNNTKYIIMIDFFICYNNFNAPWNGAIQISPVIEVDLIPLHFLAVWYRLIITIRVCVICKSCHESRFYHRSQ